MIRLLSFGQSRLSRAEVDTIGMLTSQLNQLESERREIKKMWEKSNNFGGNDRRKKMRDGNRKYELCSFYKILAK